MSQSAVKPCPMYDRVSALVNGELSGVAEREVETHLERDSHCRERFRHATASRFPDIPSYTIVRQIDKGGFGVVYKAIHHTKERAEALKLLYHQTPLVASYFENEVHLIAGLQHPLIATLYEAQLSEPPLYYSMEIVDGVRLNEYVRDQRCSLAQRIEIIREVAGALQYAHEQGVVHRDIKPQNLLIDGDGRPHIVDFGIGKRLGIGGARGSVEDGEWHEGPIGTRGYIAPEQAGGGVVDARADVFALGALLFHCITGEPAKLARDPGVRAKLLSVAGVPRVDDLDGILAHCLSTSPADRYPSCAALAADLGNYVAGRAVQQRANRSRLYLARRIGLLLLREYPLTIRMSLLVGTACLLTFVSWAAGARTLSGPLPPSGTTIIGFGDETLDAIRAKRIGADLPGLSADDPYSWRMLHGRLMEQLAVARPRVVVWDYYFPRPQPAFDDAFVRGVLALDAPVVVGAETFDPEGSPIVAPAIRAAVAGVGALYSTEPDRFDHEYEIVHALKRGFDSPRPSLTVRAFAAARFPDATPVLTFGRENRFIEVNYRRLRPVGEEALWHSTTDRIAVHDLHHVADRSRQHALPGDTVAHARVPARWMAWWRARTVPYERVLAADRAQLRAWFDGRAVLVGDMRAKSPRPDMYVNRRGETIFGCHVHADALDALLAQVHSVRLTRPALAMRNFLWCAAAGLWVSVSLTFWPGVRGRRGVAAVITLALFGVGVAITASTARLATSAWLLELGLACGALLAGGALTHWARGAREREVRESPAAVLLPEPSSTVPSTVLADTD